MYGKWKERSRVGIYLGRSPHHAATVPLILNTQTGLVSPQFHVVYDDNFDTVARDKNYESLWQYKAQLQEKDKQDSDRTDVLATSTDKQLPNLADYQTGPIPPNLQVPWDSPTAAPAPDPEGEQQQQSSAESNTGAAPSQHQRARSSHRMRQSEGDVSRNQQSQRARTDPTSESPAPAAGPAQAGNQQGRRAPRRSVNIAPTGKTRSGRQVKQRFFSYATTYESTFSPSDSLQGELEDIHPMAGLQSYAATKQRDPDTMTLERAMQEPDAEQFIRAMEKELEDHTKRGHWEVVPIAQVPRTARPINMVWSMKRKRDPTGEIIKWKARLCAHGGMQVYGDTFWDTYSPVVSWTTV